MNVSHARLLVDYTNWANARVLQMAAGLDVEAFTRDLQNSFPSVRDTLAHMLGAEWVWFERWQGRSPSALPGGADFRALDAIRRAWAELAAARERWLAQLTESALAAPLAYANMKGDRFVQPLWHQLQHVVNHATYHRGQVITMIRQSGGRVASTDLINFLRLAEADRRLDLV